MGELELHQLVAHALSDLNSLGYYLSTSSLGEELSGVGVNDRRQLARTPESSQLFAQRASF